MPSVKIYTLSTCSHCKSTKRLLNELGIPYDFVDVDLLQGQERDDVIEEVRKINPALSFPTILIGGRQIVGFKEQEIREALGR